MTTGISAAYPPAIQVQARTLEQDVAAIGEEHKRLEKDTRTLAARVHDAYTRFMMAGGVGFFGWFAEHSHIPRGSAHRYLDVHRAVMAGFGEGPGETVEPRPAGPIAEATFPHQAAEAAAQGTPAPATPLPRSMTELAKIGRALREGVPASQLQPNPGAAAKLTEAKRNAGTIERRVTVDTDAALGTALEVLRSEWQAQRQDAAPPEPELLSLLAQWLRDVSGTAQFRRMMQDLVRVGDPEVPPTPEAQQAREAADVVVDSREGEANWTCPHCSGDYDAQPIQAKRQLGNDALYTCACEACGGLYTVFDQRP